MRWLLIPTEKTYASVSEMMRPICVQRLVPHPAAIDLCPFPQIRESLIHQLRDWVFALETAGVSVNWTGVITEAVDRDDRTGQVWIGKRFREHVMYLKNWSLDYRIYEFFPDLKDKGMIVTSRNTAPDLGSDLVRPHN